MQDGCRQSRIGEQEHQHGGHVGRDHARTLGDAIDGDGLAAELRLHAHGLGESVGGHDRGGGIGKTIRARLAHQLRQAVEDGGWVERLTDDAGGSLEDFRGLGAHSLGNPGGHGLDGGDTGLAGEGIGIARVHDDGARLAGLEVGAAPIHRRGGAFGAGEGSGDHGAGIEQRQHHIRAALVADARAHGGELHARDGRKFRLGLRGQR